MDMDIARCDGAKALRSEFEMVIEDDDCPDVSFMEQPGFEEDLRAWKAGELVSLYVYARVTARPEHGDEREYRSSGVGGVIMSRRYSLRDPHLAEIFQEECRQLEAELASEGISIAD